MKIMKRILMVLGVLIVLFLIVCYIMPAKYHMERSMVMKAPVNVVFDQVNTVKNWEKWSPWIKKDPKMKLTYSGPASGKGAKYAWESDVSDVGKGNMVIAKSVPDSFTSFDIEFTGHGQGNATFTFSKVPEGTMVVWGMGGDAGMNPVGRFFGSMMDKMMGSTFESGLKDMKDLVEKMPANPTSDIKVEEVATPQMYALVTNFKCSTEPADMHKNYGDAYAKLGAYMGKNGIKSTGKPFAVTNSYSGGKIDVDAGMPTEKMGKSEGDIKAIDMKPGNALKVTYIGPYSGMKSAYDALAGYSASNHKEVTGKPWEVYVNDPMTEKDSMKYNTEIYMPVK